MTVTNYVWDVESDNLLMETDENGIATAEYTNEPDEFGNLISQRRNGATSYYHFDGLGSTRELTNSAETVTATNIYDAWSVDVASSGTTQNPFRFIGESGYYHDSNPNDYFVRVRTYSPRIARWTSADPVGFVDGPNLYRYALNNSVNVIDPTGTVGVIPTTPRKLDPTCDNLDSEASWNFAIAEWPCRSGRGFFVQRVTFSCMVCDCKQNQQAGCVFDNLRYWEVWPVSGPSTPPNQQFPGSVSDVKDTAEWTGFDPKDKRGFTRQSGTVRFFCVAPPRSKPRNGEVDLEYLVKTFTKSGPVNDPNSLCRVSTGSLLYRTDVPEFWTQGGAGGGDGKRLFQLSWNCCCDGKRANASARP